MLLHHSIAPKEPKDSDNNATVACGKRGKTVEYEYMDLGILMLCCVLASAANPSIR